MKRHMNQGSHMFIIMPCIRTAKHLWHLKIFEYLETCVYSHSLIEIWLNDNDFDLHGLSRHTVPGRHRVQWASGGVAVCIQDHVSFRERPDQTFPDSESNLQQFLLKLKGKSANASFITGVICRTPNQDIFSFNRNFNHITRYLRMTHLLGDYNINN